MALEYLTITPAGALYTVQCVGTGHAHTGPDVGLDVTCATHHMEWVWCAGCMEIWCPGIAGRNNGHQGTVCAIGTLPGP